MKTLHLLRHAKADRRGRAPGDFDRPLTPRGVEAAAVMGGALRDRASIPGIVLCSAARRARETWAQVEPELGASPAFKVLRDLYLAPPGTLLGAIRRLPDAHASALLIGHNPGMEHLVRSLAGRDSGPDAMRRLAGDFPTAALAILDFDAGRWADIGPGSGRLTALLYPSGPA